MFHIGLHGMGSPQHLILLQNAEFLTNMCLILQFFNSVMQMFTFISFSHYIYTKRCIMGKICHGNMFQQLHTIDHLGSDNTNIYKFVKMWRGQAPCVCVQNDLTRHSVYILEIAGVLTNM